MSFRIKILSVVITLIISTLACTTFLGEAPVEPEITLPPMVEPVITEISVTEIPVTEAPIAIEPVSCPVITDKIMEISTAEGEGEENLSAEETYLVTYAVSGNEISNPYYEDVKTKLKDEQQDSATHRQVWDYFTALIPADRRGVIGEYSIVTDGKDGTLAAVTQTLDDPNVWALEVDIADSSEYYSLTFTIIHEFGHLLTLGPDQVPPSLAVFNNPDDNDIYLDEVSKCPQYFPGEGCANADSYINAYYDQFWAGLHEEWNAINLEEDEDLYYEKLDDFYYKYEDQFVTSYAATNPEEDMAETWAFFVLGPKPAGSTIAEEKVLFFYRYPALVKLRGQILNNLCASFPE
jgi:hypothetical protein